MHKTQAEAIVQAILEPDLKAQEELRRKRAKEPWWLAQRRKVASLALIGFAAGAGIATYTGQRFVSGALYGGLAGAALGWCRIGWRLRRAISRE